MSATTPTLTDEPIQQRDAFVERLFMCDTPFGKFENYIFTSPPFFM